MRQCVRRAWSWLSHPDRKRSVKVTATLLLIAGSLLIFCFHPSQITRTETVRVAPDGARETITTTAKQQNGLSRLADILGTGFLVFAIWLWRGELGISSIGGVAGPPVKPQSPTPRGSLTDKETESSEEEIDSALRKVGQSPNQPEIEKLLDLFRRYRGIDVSLVAKELVISAMEAIGPLNFLRRSGILRADGPAQQRVFTLAGSLENKALDRVREEVASRHEILSEKRFVRVQDRYEVDALIACNDLTVIAEVKCLISVDAVNRLEEWGQQLLRVGRLFEDRVLVCVLVIACRTGVDTEEVKRQVKANALWGKEAFLKVVVFSENELRESGTS